MKRKTRQIVSCILAFAMSLQGIGSSGVYAAAQTLQGTDGVAVAETTEQTFDAFSGEDNWGVFFL